MSYRGVLHLIETAAFNFDTGKYSIGFRRPPDADAFVKLTNNIITRPSYNTAFSGFNISRKISAEETGKDLPNFRLQTILDHNDMGNIDCYVSTTKIRPELPYFLNNARHEVVNENQLHIVRISNQIILAELDNQIKKFNDDIDFSHEKIFETKFMNGTPTADIIMGSRTSCIRLNDAAMDVLQNRLNSNDSPSGWVR